MGITLRERIRDIVAGFNKIEQGNLIQIIANHLRINKENSLSLFISKAYKEEETIELIYFIEKNNLWMNGIDENKYAGEGAEQKVYLDEDGRHVLKLNDSIFYASWLDYFNSLQIHNLLFPDTKYELLGFKKEQEKLYAVVKQQLVESTSLTDLSDVRKYLEANGFRIIRNNDYSSEELNIILEDLHDENVLTNQGLLFFIDTVIYYIPDLQIKDNQ